ncbi:MAG TPA: sigma-70 family RNA polymerase sigma factor [Verrucomicrobiae bacterium]|jgi:RNA polymerase sigma-70 factor (ECF subfamily)|nr:sigma-70 family RNA polymerase sigma factor [Verrucomicrobiae bacterium]
MAVTQQVQAGAVPGCETIEQLFAALESPLLSYALRLTEASGAAEDCVQEAFMKLQAQFKEVREPRRWLYRTVHNLALNHQRQSRKIIPLDPGSPAAEIADPRPLPDEAIVRSEGLGLVRLTLETLDERSREVIRLKFTENLSYKEISARTGLKPGHVGYLLHHALKSMADELARNGVMP